MGCIITFEVPAVPVLINNVAKYRFQFSSLLNSSFKQRRTVA